MDAEPGTRRERERERELLFERETRSAKVISAQPDIVSTAGLRACVSRHTAQQQVSVQASLSFKTSAHWMIDALFIMHRF